MENEKMMTGEQKEAVKKRHKELKEIKQMSQQEAFDLIKEWGEALEVRLLEEDFEEVQKEIWMAVKKERLTFDENEEVFTYKLKKPIRNIETGQPIYSILKIQETSMQNKREMSKYKNEIDQAAALYKCYCTDGEGNSIEHGFLTRIYDRDSAILNAIILGFFVQAIPAASAK